jgi:POT family proton-dependent oligopeptide transporter
MAQYRTAPDHEDTGWPKGVPYIIGNEACERFSYYGMKAILMLYIVGLLKQSGLTAQLAESEATEVFHTFGAGVYALPMVGALIADRWWGKYNTIMWLSLAYCAGHACLAIFDGNFHGTMVGLALICVGAGGIKPCVSANVGDQFGRSNWFRVERVYQWFYFSINLGSAFATWIIPYSQNHWGYSVAFAIPGILMGIATAFFWAGRRAFVHVPPKPGGLIGAIDVLTGVLLFMVIATPMFANDIVPAYAKLGYLGQILVSVGFLVAGLVVFELRQRMETDDGFLAVLTYSLRTYFTGRELDPLPSAATDQVRAVGADVAGSLRAHPFWGPAARRFGQDATEGPLAVLRIISVFALVSVFWALFEQHGSSWVMQANEMNRVVDLGFWKFEVMASQISTANPIIVMVLVPLMGFGVYPFVEKVLKIPFTPLRRITVGMFVAAASFAVVAVLQRHIDAKESVHVGWQVLAYVVLTAAEVMVSVTGLEFAYTQSPPRVKSLVMGFWMLSIAAGNLMVKYAAHVGSGRPRVELFWFFSKLMFGAAVLFALRAYFYKYKSYTQQ